jgi:hypothetical protein
MQRRRKRRSPFAAYAALIFNAALCATPLMASQAALMAYGGPRSSTEATEGSLDATREAMDSRFQRLASAGPGSPREVWAGMVRTEIETGEMATVNGLLLAAPAMLKGADGEALEARIAVADKRDDAAMIAAAVSFLPNEVQADYERRTTSLMSLLQNAAPGADAEGATASPVNYTPPAAREEERSEFNMLGDMPELAMQAARWAREDRFDEFPFVLSGFGLILASDEAREGASIVMSAYRSDRLDPDFKLYLQSRLFQAAPPQRLKRQIDAQFQSEFGYATDGPAAVEAAFREASTDRNSAAAAEALSRDLRLIQDISRNTSPASAVAILSQVHNAGDLNRARLVARAGGDRAVALAKYDGARLLDTARTEIRWSNPLRMQLAGLAACLAILILLSFNVFWRSVRRNAPVRRSAIYALEEAA